MLLFCIIILLKKSFFKTKEGFFNKLFKQKFKKRYIFVVNDCQLQCIRTGIWIFSLHYHCNTAMKV